uniref:Trifunctional purine biosynthetic protein adenosine-3 n=1 Tax=Strigamia maritima TaxID=126957 RepID=T1JDR4_STRMM
LRDDTIRLAILFQGERPTSIRLPNYEAALVFVNITTLNYMASVLVVGSGGREHAIVWKLSESENVKTVYVCPGNPGCFNEKKVNNFDADVNNHDEIVNLCRIYKIDLVVVGPELPLANGLADDLKRNGINCFGPSKNASQLEASKDFAKQFMQRHNIPTAQWKSFTDFELAKMHILECSYNAHVIKASGLAAGKGVIVATSNDEAVAAAELILRQKSFGKAGETILIEELLDGEEFSVLAFSDGHQIALMPVAQDHKRLLDGDKGPNTGGMGAYAPCPQMSDTQVNYIKNEIIQKSIDGMQEENEPYVGVLYVGLMLTADGPKVLEYNCRFGDPEAEVLLSLLKSDLYLTVRACVDGNLDSALPQWHANTYSVGVVLASEKYPLSSGENQLIEGIDSVSNFHHVFHAGTRKNDHQLFTNGGRVLVVVASASSLTAAALSAQAAVEKIIFVGEQHRSDIAFKGIFSEAMDRGLTYASSGVDIDKGDQFVEAIKSFVAKTHRKEVLGSIGGFGGCFNLKAVKKYKNPTANPILVSGTDGVGTKLNIAQELNQHKSIGIDLVAMCVNDILTLGAEPLFFLDYFACSNLVTEMAKNVVEGVANGCTEAGCALLGGETAEMPGMYKNNHYDIAGFAVGVVDQTNLLPKSDIISSGDVIIGLSSSGVHSNGFSLVRKVVASQELQLNSPAPFNIHTTLGEELLKPTKIYVKCMLPLIEDHLIKAAAHITGGGLTGNLPRILPKNMSAVLDANKWEIPSVFGWLAVHGISDTEMLKTFNCGIGMALVVRKEDSCEVMRRLHLLKEQAWIIGHIVTRATGNECREKVVIQNAKTALLKSVMCSDISQSYITKISSHKRRVAILISGTGTNLQALIDSTNNPFSSSKIVLVISNIPGVKGLERAQKYNIPTQVISHKDYKTRLAFDMAVNEVLNVNEIEIVCLAGFMRILTGEFVRLWRGKLLNIHPSLLPSFPGLNAHKQAIEAGVCFTGCTVHFVVEEVDSGGIVAQEAVQVLPFDTEEILAERVLLAEHQVYPRALELLSRRQVSLSDDNKVLRQ